MSDIGKLIDEVLLSGEFIGMNIIACRDGTIMVSLRKDYNTSTCDQLPDRAAPPSEHIRDICHQHLKIGRWAWLADSVAPIAPEANDFDDLGI